MHSRIEKIAAKHLQMQVPDTAHIQIVPQAASEAPAEKGLP